MENIEKKNAIIKSAAKLFAEKGYNAVYLEDVFAAAGVKDATGLTLFSTKPALRKAVYLRYRKIHEEASPAFESVMLSAKASHPYDVLLSLDYKLPPEEGEFLTHCFLGALQDFHYNQASGDLIKINTIHNTLGNAKILMDYLIALKKIEPVDTESLARCFAFYTFASSIFDKMMAGAAPEEWGSGLNMILSLIKPTAQSVAKADIKR